MLRTYHAVLDGFRRRAAVCIGLSAISGGAEALGIAALLPLLSGSIGSEAKSREYFGLRGDTLTVVALAVIVGLGLFAALLRFIADMKIVRLQADIEMSLRSRMCDALFAMDWPEFLLQSLGETGKAIVVEATQIAQGVYYFVTGLGYLIVSACFVVVAFVISVPMTVATLAFGGLMALVYARAGRRAETSSLGLSGEAAELTEISTELLGNAKFYRSTGQRDPALRRARESFDRWRQDFIGVQRHLPTTRLAFDVSGLVFISAVLGITLVALGQSPLEPLVFLALFYRLTPKLQQGEHGVLQGRGQIGWWVTWKERYDTARAVAERPSGQLALAGPPTVRFEHVGYTFPGREIPAVADLSWHLPPGGCVALVGESGGGKSTTLDIVTGLLRPTVGSVRLDDMDLFDVDLESWRRRVGFVMQDAPLFFGTIFDNIAWGDPAPDHGRVQEAAELAHLGAVLEELPDGLDTAVGPRGGRLSGGQRQRVALARALYQEPWLLVLDEATSALDSDSEHEIREALRSLKGSVSMLIVAHRLRSVELADHILVLSGGKVIEEGGWAELSQRSDGVFQRMLLAQGVI